MLLISAKVDGEFKQRLIAQCERNIIKLRRHSRSDYSRGPEGVISIIPVQSGGTVVTGAVHRTRFVLLSLFRFLLLSVSQLVKTAAALGARLMTRRGETKDSFAKRQVYVADKLDETALSSHPSFFVRFPLSTRVRSFRGDEPSPLYFSSRFFLERCICFRETVTLFRRTDLCLLDVKGKCIDK